MGTEPGLKVTDDYGADLGPAAQARPSKIVAVGETGRKAGDKPYGVARRVVECHLDLLWAYRHINDRQWRAGAQLRVLWLVEHHSQGYAIRREERGRSLNAPWNHRAADEIEDKDKLRDALDALTEEQAIVVQRVCGADESAAGRMRVLIPALDTLAEHFAIPAGWRRKE